MIRTLLFVLLLVVLVTAGCDTNAGQDEFFLQSRQPPAGITQTTESGEIIGDPDPDDWRTAPAFQGSIEVMPAAPNPVQRNELMTITVQDTFGDVLTGGVFVSGIDDNGRFVRLDVDEGTGPFYSLTFNPTLLRIVGGDDARFYRLRVFTNDSRIISYGDIQVR
jgi:hypothetical protein